MGLFGKLKDNLSGGGVKLSLDSPDSFALDGPEIKVNVTIINGDAERVVNRVVLQLIEVSEESSLGYSDEDGSSKEESVILKSISSERITLSAQESKIISLALRPKGEDTANIPTFTGKAKDALAKFSNALDTNEYSYYLKAKADLEAIALDPSCSKPVSISK